MSERSFERWEEKLRDTAQAFPYPPTPHLASAVRAQLAVEAARPRRSILLRRQVAWAALIVLLILGGLLAVPEVRARVMEFLQVGSIRIFMTEPTPTVTPIPVTPQPSTTATPTPRPSPTPLSSLLNLAGEMTLATAQKRTGFPIRLPAYPADLGPPHRIFFQDIGGPAVVLVWLDSDQPERVRLSLHQLGPGTYATKGEPQVIEETTVNGQPAYWTTGPYLLEIRQGNRTEFDIRRLVEGHVLLWVEGEITYRLETDLGLEEAVRIAESLR